ncbi:hypothetical protein D5R81_04750 [Parashewanella spongiae]|uniref:Flagellar assembly protein T N-terminal domain-containing protein n=1 Tax=Parashewanella spongiae TaxID=342950 RepID=A0A3A6TZU9_9GAMM|nr:hypothetical protein [Parashewanella spongiae]MCL1077294.1 hypothetical protein [Parashewanella spongiae]RJY18528.1 hypothetical protein D5R81_04750 [Parashewanella spongiae]
MINKSVLAAVVTGLSFAVSAEVIVLEDGRLETQACAYGRGTTAISSAKAQAASILAEFIKGNKSLNLNSSSSDVSIVNDDVHRLYESNREQLLEGIQHQALMIDTSSPRLEGNDTCVTATLALNTKAKIQPVKWDDAAQQIAVTVIGEGWPEQGKTALKNAENDALQRAVSQVVGVWLTQSHAQSSQTDLLIENDVESTSMKEIIGQQLSMHSEGLIKSWQTLDSTKMDNRGIQITLNVVVEKRPLIQQASQMLSQIGSPYVKVDAPEPLKTVISAWLGEQGIEVTSDSSLTVKAKAKLRTSGNNQRLDIRINVKDHNNIYSSWKNDPSLIALPKDDSIMTDLIDVHFADENQLQDLHKNLQKGFTQVVARGGLSREIIIPNRLLKQTEHIASVFNTLAGVSNVAIHQNNNNTVVRVRYKGSSGELAQVVHLALAAIAAKPLPQIKINNNFTLTYL